MRRLLPLSLLLTAALAACARSPSSPSAVDTGRGETRVEPPAFDPNDAERTLAWVAAERGATVEAAPKESEFALSGARKKYTEAVSGAARGRAVRWVMGAQQIEGQGGCRISPVARDGGRDPHTGLPRRFALLVLANSEPVFGARPSDLGWLLQAAAGDRVVVTGRVHRVSVERAEGPVGQLFDSVFFDLEEGRVEKP